MTEIESKLREDLKKYEEEINAINKRLDGLQEQRQTIEQERQNVITHGRRVEGIVAYIRAALEEDKPEGEGGNAGKPGPLPPKGEPKADGEKDSKKEGEEGAAQQ